MRQHEYNRSSGVEKAAYGVHQHRRACKRQELFWNGRAETASRASGYYYCVSVHFVEDVRITGVAPVQCKINKKRYFLQMPSVVVDSGYIKKGTFPQSPFRRSSIGIIF